MKHLIVGTAGHVDHGKTALIKRLSGIDTDRLKEEKERGISIDIGFASLRFGDDLLLGIIDVPGHERFLKNMLAGTGGIDMVLLVIAADEGIMPQTREHFEMIRLLGIQQGVVVLNKIDKVETEWVDLMEEEIRIFLKGTFLEQAPLCRVSAHTGEGIELLKETILNITARIVERDKTAPFRMWIDRAFNLKGQGLVVTGSVLSGTIGVGAGLTLYPDGASVKIRGIESHNREQESACAGQRTSFKLTGIALEAVERGMLLAERGYSKASKVWDGVIRWHKPYPSGTRIRLHLGTGETIGRVSYRDKEDGGSGLEIVRLHLEQPVAAALGDQAILRRFSPQDLIGGITILAKGEGIGRRDLLLHTLGRHLHQQNIEEMMATLLLLFDTPPSREDWQKAAGYLNPHLSRQIVQTLINKGRVKQVGNYYLSTERISEWQQKMLRTLAEYHRARPDQPGISRETLRQKIRLDAVVADWFWQEAEKNKQVKIQGEFVADPAHAASHGGNIEELKLRLSVLVKPIPIVDVNLAWLAEKLQRSEPEIKPFFEQLLRDGEILRLPGVHVYRKTIQYIGAIIHQHFQTNTTLSVADLRDKLNTSRRVAIPLMEYFDANKYTVRDGDLRRPGPLLKNFSE